MLLGGHRDPSVPEVAITRDSDYRPTGLFQHSPSGRVLFFKRHRYSNLLYGLVDSEHQETVAIMQDEFKEYENLGSARQRILRWIMDVGPELIANAAGAVIGVLGGLLVGPDEAPALSAAIGALVGVVITQLLSRLLRS